jgi:RNA polymerase sigma-70 factor, ECF subfamily
LQRLLNEMVETYGDRIYRLALRYTGERCQAQDLTQETFLRAYQHLDSYDRSKPAGPWLFKIAGNLCRNWLRDNREQPAIFSEDFYQSSDPGPEDLYLSRERKKELMQAMFKMPLIYREVLLLKHVGELNYAEICEALDLNLSLVKNRLYRGRVMLRDYLEKGGSN